MKDELKEFILKSEEYKKYLDYYDLVDDEDSHIVGYVLWKNFGMKL